MRPKNYDYLVWLASKFNLALNFMDQNPFNGKLLLLERKSDIVRRHQGGAYVTCYPFTEKLFNPHWLALFRKGQLAGWLAQSRMEGFIDVREDLGSHTVDDFFNVVIYTPSHPMKIITSQNPGPFIQTLMDVIKMRNEQRVIGQYQRSKEEQLHRLENELMRKYAKFAETIKKFGNAIIYDEESEENGGEESDYSRKTNIKLREGAKAS